MAFLKNFSKLSIINLATAGLSLAWIPILINSLGAEEYGKFILSTTIAIIIFSLLYINNWQWLLIQIAEKRLSATKTSIINDAAFTTAALILASCIPTINSTEKLLPQEYTGIIISYLIGLSVSHQTIYTAYYRNINKFTQPALVSLASETIKAGIIISCCLASNDHYTTINFLENLLWLFGIPHIIANIYCSIKLKPWIYPGLRHDLDSFFWYNIYLHPKNISDLLINHFDKIIVTANLGFHSLATYDLLKKCGYALSKILSPAYPLVFRDLVSTSTNTSSTKKALKKNTKRFTIVSIAIYLACEVALYCAPLLIQDNTLQEALLTHQTEIRLYIACHLIGFSFCSYHLVLSALGKTKIEFYITTLANIAFIALFYAATKQSLLLGIWAIFLQYIGLIIAKAWITKNLT